MIDISRMNLPELRNAVNSRILKMIGELEEYEGASDVKFKTEKDYKRVCGEGSRLLDKLGLRVISNGELSTSSPEFQRCVHSLRMLVLESEQEQIDEEVVKFAYMTVRKYAPIISRELTEYYVSNGPEAQEGSDF